MESAPYSHLLGRKRGAGAGAMLVAYRLAGLSALEGHYAGLNRWPQCGHTWSQLDHLVQSGGERQMIGK